MKAGFPETGQRIGFMGRRSGIKIRADYLALVVHTREGSSRLFGDRLEFPGHDGIYLLRAQPVEDIFTQGLNRAGKPSGMNVYAQISELEAYRVC